MIRVTPRGRARPAALLVLRPVRLLDRRRPPGANPLDQAGVLERADDGVGAQRLIGQAGHAQGRQSGVAGGPQSGRRVLDRQGGCGAGAEAGAAEQVGVGGGGGGGGPGRGGGGGGGVWGGAAASAPMTTVNMPSSPARLRAMSSRD